MANKVKFGLSNVHIAPITYSGSNVTYGTIFELPGAVNLSLDPAGESADFYADNTKYFSDYAIKVVNDKINNCEFLNVEQKQFFVEQNNTYVKTFMRDGYKYIEENPS